MTYDDRSCRQWEPRLSDFVDGGLPDAEREALRAHLDSCTSCPEVLAGIRRVQSRAAALDDRPPTVDLWPGIAERIGASVPTSTPVRPGAWRQVPQLLAAGIVVALIGVGIGRAAGPTRAPIAAVDSTDVTIQLASVPDGATQYEAAIGELIRVLEESRSRLDPRTVRVIEDNLLMIDRALQRAREALATDPQSEFLQRHLERTARQKLDILQRVTRLTSADGL